MASASGFAPACHKIVLDAPRPPLVDVVLRPGVLVSVTVPAPDSRGQFPDCDVIFEATGEAAGVVVRDWRVLASKPFTGRLLPGVYVVRVSKLRNGTGDGEPEATTVRHVEIPDRPAFRLTLPP